MGVGFLCCCEKSDLVRGCGTCDAPPTLHCLYTFAGLTQLDGPLVYFSTAPSPLPAGFLPGTWWSAEVHQDLGGIPHTFRYTLRCVSGQWYFAWARWADSDPADPDVRAPIGAAAIGATGNTCHAGATPFHLTNWSYDISLDPFAVVDIGE